MTAEWELTGPEGTRFSSIRHVEETGSTNADLLAVAREALSDGGNGLANDGLVLVTDHQSAGRGRQARQWHDQPGNSALMSVLLHPPIDWVALMPLVAGMAVVHGLSSLVDPGGSHPPAQSAEPAAGPPVALKWPNDVLAPGHGDRKLAGILVEATSQGDRMAVVVGMGINVRWAEDPPAELAARAVTTEQVIGRPLDRWDVVHAVLRGLETHLVAAEEGGRDAVLVAYRQHCLTLGRAVRFETPSGVVAGVATAIADDGGLVVDTESGIVTLNAGEAHHLP